MNTATGLLIRKLAVAFLVGFVGALIPLLQGWSQAPNFHFERAAIISLLAGLVGAGLRAALAFSPLNAEPTDKLHTIKAIEMKGDSGQASLVVALIILVIIVALAGGFWVNPWLFLVLLLIVLFAWRGF